MKFTELDLRPELLESIQEMGFADCTPIQELVIPQVLRGKDVSGLAQTGTGKTGAFVIPLMDRILRMRAGETGERVPTNWNKNSYVLVLVPTRELATQVEEAIVQFGAKGQMRSAVIVGGAGYDDQRAALRKGVEFIVGTPGRLLDLYKSHDLDLNGVAAIVFDEADRMFDMGFKDDMKYILKRVPRTRQFLLFSATLNFEVLNTAYEFGAEPVEFNVSRDQVTAEGITHEILNVGQDEKPMYLLSVIKKYAPQQCIVFSNFKNNVRPIARFLKDNGFEAIEMSSLLSQAQRNKVLESFKSGKMQILVATDVAARGLDVKGIDLVVNFDLPDDPEGYVHRIGRTGRAGDSGRAVGLVSDRDVEALVRVETYLKEKLKIGWIEDSELIREYKSFVRDHSPGNRRGPPPPRRPARAGGAGTGHGRGRPASGPAGSGPRPSRGATGTSHSGANRPHGNGPRPPRGGQGSTTNQGSNRPHGVTGNQVPPANSHGQTADGNPTAVAHQHRDRRTGRHGGIANAATGGHSQNQGASHARGRNSGAKRPSSGHASGGNRNRPHDRNGRSGSANTNQRRPLRSGAQGQGKADAGVGQKIKSFFSKLFK